MSFKYLREIFKLTSVVFTVITLFQLITKQSLDNEKICELLALSLSLSLIKIVINKYIISKDSIFNPLLYIVIIWLMIVASNYLFNWNMSLSLMFSTFIEVILIYICVRLINYQYEKIDVKKMNEILDRNRKNKNQQ
ncbi:MULTISPECIES: hypothetical protein [Clostridium]|uniref:Neutral ceramidase superfamily lipid hydrolase n=1 Tax=Clostridium beijerinckii TaxID=1520 RepID=A0A1S8PPD5_CLOBE|nr:MULTISPECIES: hypothetical protein [Clostridium]NOW90294.1 putative neutral ceramidase superfamily lipid hydrolase [Clostridium beijerinckii]NRT80192.1 putative neutral ceramidase superfamily lipid hydrolase [Clostridium beijerinckii]NSB13801.1 putative neutral ceramidase superfamily lipid hydrolase [Clostridium beijerinckii]OOM30413.1 hypothetical protein CLOBE_16570 [Clostridium beijerinckii]OOM48735.1 hypothetical protein CBEIJ_20520 [Clostridium beijerinckii]